MWTVCLIYRLFYLGDTSRIIEVLKNLLLGDFSGFIMVSVLRQTYTIRSWQSGSHTDIIKTIKIRISHTLKFVFSLHILIADKLLRLLGGFKCLCEVPHLESLDTRVVTCSKFLWFKFSVLIHLKLSQANS